jgi:phosphate-selective porin OprO and OprP
MISFPRASLALLPALLAMPLYCSAETAPTSVEERLKRIEAQLERLESRLNDTVSADELAPTLKEFSDLTRQIGWDGKAQLTVVKAGGKEQKLSLGGYIQMHGEAGDASDSRFTGINDRVFLRRARVTVKGAFAEDFEFTLQSDFGNNSIAGVSGYRAQLADAFVAWTKYEAANVQVGQFKTPFGYEQLVSDTKTLTVERSLPNDMLTVGRQIGLGLSGSFLEKKLTYAAGAFNGNGTNNGNNDNDHFMYAGRIGAQLLNRGTTRGSVGVNGFSSRDTGTFTGRRTGWGVDGQLALGRLDLAAEYLHLLSNRFTGTDTTADGWSAQAAYFVVPKALQVVLRYETYDANVNAPDTTSESWVFGANYFIKGDDLKLCLNYVLGDPAGPLSDQGRLLGRFQVIF